MLSLSSSRAEGYGAHICDLLPLRPLGGEGWGEVGFSSAGTPGEFRPPPMARDEAVVQFRFSTTTA
jgi:hypothetical protein